MLYHPLAACDNELTKIIRWRDKAIKDELFMNLKIEEKKKKAAFRRNLLAQFYEEQNGWCAYCQKQTWLPKPNKDGKYQNNGLGPEGEACSLRATFEHLKKQEHGGEDTYENGVMACNKCNSERGDYDAMEYVMLFQQNPEFNKHRDRERNERKVGKNSEKESKFIVLIMWVLSLFPDHIKQIEELADSHTQSECSFS